MCAALKEEPKELPRAEAIFATNVAMNVGMNFGMTFERLGRIAESPQKRNRLPRASASRLSVTVSIGVAEPSTRNRQPEQVIQAADQALYRAKNKGRNRVELVSTAPLRLAEAKRPKASRL
jgi:GGDEF domain-containing protein